MCPVQTDSLCTRMRAQGRMCLFARVCLCSTVHPHVGECCLSAVCRYSMRGESAQMLLGGLQWHRAPPVRFSAEQCAWTCLRGCEAKHHQFVFRQHIPRGTLPSCMGTCVQQTYMCVVAHICLRGNICGKRRLRGRMLALGNEHLRQCDPTYPGITGAETVLTK